MPSTTVQYISPSQDSKESKNTPKDIKILYLKATIAILTLALATVSVVLIWRLLASKNDYDEDLTEVSFTAVTSILVFIIFLLLT